MDINVFIVSACWVPVRVMFRRLTRKDIPHGDRISMVFNNANAPISYIPLGTIVNTYIYSILVIILCTWSPFNLDTFSEIKLWKLLHRKMNTQFGNRFSRWIAFNFLRKPQDDLHRNQNMTSSFRALKRSSYHRIRRIGLTNDENNTY